MFRTTTTKTAALFFAIALNCLFFNTLTAQEMLQWAPGNPVLKNYMKNHSETAGQKNTLPDTLELPFIDDFSKATVYPDEALWLDNFAYINTSLGVNPPSVGIATLDAVSFDGSVYSDYGFNTIFEADVLTSKPIDLSEPGISDVYLSFFYQPQGLGDEPETQDSLVVEFYSPTTFEWTQVWAHEGSANQSFQQIILPVEGNDYMQKGFQFRFKNYVSLTGSSFPSMVTNADFWHIDYVRLDKDRSPADLVLNDIAHVQPLGSLLEGYEAVPWTHFNNSTVPLKSVIPVVYQNNDDILRTIDLRQFELEDLMGNGGTTTLDGGSDDLQAGETKPFNAPHTFTFSSNTADSALFELRANITTDDYDYEVNNSILYRQKFYNYYAYDDGSAEAGYGLVGQGSKNGEVAYKFTTLQDDTLQAVQMYFVQSYNNMSQKYFYLTVWDDNEGEPGDTLYSELGVLPQYDDQLNQYSMYRLSTPVDTPLVVSGTFYVGWIQTTTEKLNIGFDFDNVANENLFYNVSGYWEQSQIEGAVMIRPVFGKPVPGQLTGVEPLPVPTTVELYPNPARQHFFVKPPDDTTVFNVSIIDGSGRQVAAYPAQTATNAIDISHLQAGFYVVKIMGRNVSATSRLLIIK